MNEKNVGSARKQVWLPRPTSVRISSLWLKGSREQQDGFPHSVHKHQLVRKHPIEFGPSVQAVELPTSTNSYNCTAQGSEIMQTAERRVASEQLPITAIPGTAGLPTPPHRPDQQR